MALSQKISNPAPSAKRVSRSDRMLMGTAQWCRRGRAESPDLLADITKSTLLCALARDSGSLPFGYFAGCLLTNIAKAIGWRLGTFWPKTIQLKVGWIAIPIDLLTFRFRFAYAAGEHFLDSK